MLVGCATPEPDSVLGAADASAKPDSSFNASSSISVPGPSPFTWETVPDTEEIVDLPAVHGIIRVQAATW